MDYKGDMRDSIVMGDWYIRVQFFKLKIPGPGKSWKITGPGNFWKLKLKVMESPGKISLKVMHFSSGSCGKQAAVV